MAFVDPSKPIILCTEANFNEGLSAALLQKTDKGIQLVHFISQTMTETKKRYSQTEKDALTIKWAEERLRIYLLGAPRFRIVTAHKPLDLCLTKNREVDHGNAGRGLQVGV